MTRLSLLPLALLTAAAHAAPNPAPAVTPAVRSWAGAEGVVALRSAALVVDAAHRAALEPVAILWSAELRAAGLGEHPVRVAHEAAAGDIFLTLKPGVVAGSPTDEAYTVSVAAGRPVVITGASRTGVFYGTRTLHQMLTADRPGLTVPCGEIADHPTTRGRMFMLDVGRKPTSVTALKDFIRTLAYYKFNEFHLHLSDEAFGGVYSGFRIHSDTFPGLASKDLAYSKQEIRELQDFAKLRGIVITPEIDMPGHSGCFTKYWPDLTLKDSSGKVYPNYMDVTNPATVGRMKRLLDEMIPLFDAPDFHIGTDEYRVGGADRVKLHEAFRRFINTMNAHVRSHGKTMRIWSGFEHMAGTTPIDPSVTIDMWETDDAKGRIALGHKIINSNHGRTYIVPGAHYYGISNPGIYDGWEPWMVSGDNAKNPAPSDPGLLGGKLHVWADHGPTGWTQTEIAEVARTGLQTFGEKLWGVKGSPDYKRFRARSEKLREIPETTVYARPLGTPIGLPGSAELVANEEFTLTSPGAVVKLPWADRFADNANLAWPWTLTFEVMKTAESGTRGVIFSSDLVEIASDYTRDDEVKSKDPKTGKEVKTKVARTGLGVIRAAGAYTRDGEPGTAAFAKDVSAVVGPKLPLNTWVKVTVRGLADKTVVDIDGVRAGESRNRTVCPLTTLGSPFGASFVGKVRAITIRDRALTDKAAAEAAGLPAVVNLAEGKPATASAADTAHDFTADKLTDGDTATRWSSGPTNSPAWVRIDLGAPVPVGRVRLHWEAAFARNFRIETSTDGDTWLPAATGAGRAGVTESKFPLATARHLRVSMDTPATPWGYSLHEIEVSPGE